MKNNLEMMIAIIFFATSLISCLHHFFPTLGDAPHVPQELIMAREIAKTKDNCLSQNKIQKLEDALVEHMLVN